VIRNFIVRWLYRAVTKIKIRRSIIRDKNHQYSLSKPSRCYSSFKKGTHCEKMFLRRAQNRHTVNFEPTQRITFQNVYFAHCACKKTRKWRRNELEESSSRRSSLSCDQHQFHSLDKLDGTIIKKKKKENETNTATVAEERKGRYYPFLFYGKFNLLSLILRANAGEGRLASLNYVDLWNPARSRSSTQQFR